MELVSSQTPHFSASTFEFSYDLTGDTTHPESLPECVLMDDSIYCPGYAVYGDLPMTLLINSDSVHRLLLIKEKSTFSCIMGYISFDDEMISLLGTKGTVSIRREKDGW